MRLAFWKKQPEAAASFTGNCPVRQHTADDAFVGRCWRSTYDGVCWLHGDVSRWLAPGADLIDADDREIPRR